MKVAVAAARADSSETAGILSTQLGFPLIELPPAHSLSDFTVYDYLLVLQDSKLFLRSTSSSGASDLCVDFADAKLSYRVKSSGKSQNIAKAIGIKGSQRPSVLDATAGLGKDAFLFASMGCEVLLLERSPIVHALLANGLDQREGYSADICAVLDRMQLQCAEFLEFEPDSREIDVIYLDPMFPERRKSAKVKKEMAALQRLLGHQSDGADLLEHGLSLAKKRVVVKRAKLSPILGERKPDIQFGGKSSRFDVYLIN